VGTPPPFDKDALTPRHHPLRSTTDLRRDQRVIGERIKDHYRRKYTVENCDPT
jgi:hypothetical protein